MERIWRSLETVVTAAFRTVATVPTVTNPDLVAGVAPPKPEVAWDSGTFHGVGVDGVFFDTKPTL